MRKFSFQDIEVSVTPTHDTKQWYMTVEQVAEAYGKEPDSILHTIRRHSDEIRDGVEKGVDNLSTPGGVQPTIILYREGVIKLGFFIRGQRAAAFRQFATDLVVQHLQSSGQDSPAGFSEFMESFSEFRKEVNTKLDNLVGIADTVFGDDKGEIQSLVEEVSRMYRVDGRTVWGWIQTELDVQSYKKQNRKIINFLRTKLGKGLSAVPAPES